jgi:DtxR family Mn-dependent transcriptional regulator
MKISPNKEDYIKAIYALNGAHEVISNKDIANELSVSAASVTDMNARLVKENLISYYPYKGVQLTALGVQVTNQLIRKHRLWEVFLYEKLGFQWNEVHDEADRLEHASSDKVTERLNDLLGNPQYDPHGGLIPNADGTIDEEKIKLVPLTAIEIDQYFIVKEVPDDEELLNYLFDKGISINDKYKLIDINAYDGMLTIKDVHTKDEVTISEKALEKIKVIQLMNG